MKIFTASLAVQMVVSDISMTLVNVNRCRRRGLKSSNGLSMAKSLCHLVAVQVTQTGCLCYSRVKFTK